MIVEELPERIRNEKYYVQGSAARIDVSKSEHRRRSAVIITTGDDDTNIYLTIYCASCIRISRSSVGEPRA